MVGDRLPGVLSSSTHACADPGHPFLLCERSERSRSSDRSFSTNVADWHVDYLSSGATGVPAHLSPVPSPSNSNGACSIAPTRFTAGASRDTDRVSSGFTHCTVSIDSGGRVGPSPTRGPLPSLESGKGGSDRSNSSLQDGVDETAIYGFLRNSTAETRASVSDCLNKGRWPDC